MNQVSPSSQVLVEQICHPAAPPLCLVPLWMQPIAAGFPSPADDYLVKRLDLNQHLVQHPAATFFARARGDSMQGVGIFTGDLLIVDRALTAVDGDIVVAAIGGNLVVKRLQYRGDRPLLVPENESYSPIEIDEDTDFQILGVVSSAVHYLRR